jgi:hypothetical protein
VPDQVDSHRRPALRSTNQPRRPATWPISSWRSEQRRRRESQGDGNRSSAADIRMIAGTEGGDAQALPGRESL